MPRWLLSLFVDSVDFSSENWTRRVVVFTVVLKERMDFTPRVSRMRLPDRQIMSSGTLTGHRLNPRCSSVLSNHCPVPTIKSCFYRLRDSFLAGLINRGIIATTKCNHLRRLHVCTALVPPHLYCFHRVERRHAYGYCRSTCRSLFTLPINSTAPVIFDATPETTDPTMPPSGTAAHEW
ncbi:hypothetical protein KCP76_02750 [Salmonella enterica subsp. enterica serovar Weltevreden]|nr:hypothetical protein KCP76_02750 [Salmonella enterica subsp. enterica serovar Weltevreden]